VGRGPRKNILGIKKGTKMKKTSEFPVRRILGGGGGRRARSGFLGFFKGEKQKVVV